MLLRFLLCVALAACAHRCSTPTTLRAMTYNIHAGHGNLDAVAATIRDAHADVIGLQEVDVKWSERSQFVDQAAALGAALGMTVRFAPIYELPGEPPRRFGVAILSRLPITRWQNDSLTRLSTQTTNATPARMPGLLDATIDVRGTPVRVFVTHLDYRPDPAVRATQVGEILAQLDDAPTIVLGDFNAGPVATELAPLRARLVDAAPNAGLTYPAESPTNRIDYVLTSRHFAVRDARVLPVLASDHRPVVVELVLR